MGSMGSIDPMVLDFTKYSLQISAVFLRCSGVAEPVDRNPNDASVINNTVNPQKW